MGKILGWLILLGIIGYGGYLGVHWIKIRLNYADIKDKAETMLSPSSSILFKNIPDELMEVAEKKGIPLKRDSIKLLIDEWEGYRVLSFRYSDSLLLFNRKPLYFRYSFVDTVPFKR
ncbi:MAG: hypothetical protein U9N06_01360 [candidate division WOR-3 bacterium]|nr:hypothetical protein [candidate division WOR-3 bacterium]